MIRVGFSHATGFWTILSWVIRKAMNRPYSHCWLLLQGEDGFNGEDVVLEENEKGGLHYIPWIGYEVGKKVVKLVDPPTSLKPGVAALNQRLGTGYDFPGLFGEGWTLIMKEWFKRKVTNPLRNSKSMWCSEAVAYAIEKSGYVNMKTNDWQRCTPADVDDLLQGKTIE